MVLRPVIFTSSVSYPINETINVVASLATFKLNLPLASVAVPVAVPFIVTFAPAIAEPSDLSVTVPDTSRVWALARALIRRNENSNSFLFIDRGLGLVGVDYLGTKGFAK